jgi:hypothetical protein
VILPIIPRDVVLGVRAWLPHIGICRVNVRGAAEF